MSAPQGTLEWRIERAGHATASRFCDVLAKIKSGESADRRKYRLQLVTERLTGLPIDGYTNAAMQWGIDTEPAARSAYEAHTGRIVTTAGFIRHQNLPWCGVSPDGLVGGDGGLEIKCPESHTHVEYLTAGQLPAKYKPQVQGQMWVTGRQWVDFVSFDPRMPEHLRLLVVRVERDDDYIQFLAGEVERFLGEVEADYQRLMQRAA